MGRFPWDSHWNPIRMDKPVNPGVDGYTKTPNQRKIQTTSY